MVSMIEVIIPLMFIISPTGERGKFYSIFYPFVIVLSQLGGMTTSTAALGLGWQLVHMYTSAVLLVLALVCIVIMHNQRFSRKMPLYQIDGLRDGFRKTTGMVFFLQYYVYIDGFRRVICVVDIAPAGQKTPLSYLRIFQK